MVELRAKVRKWGNSLGVILPKSAGIVEDEEVIVVPARGKGTHVRDIFGRAKLRKPVAELTHEIDEELA